MHFSSWKCYKSNCYISYHNWTILSHFVHAIYYTCNLLHVIIFIYSMPFVDSFAANTASVCVKVSRCVCEVFECVFYVWCGLWCPGAGRSGQWGWLQTVSFTLVRSLVLIWAVHTADEAAQTAARGSDPCQAHTELKRNACFIHSLHDFLTLVSRNAWRTRSSSLIWGM